MDNELVQYVKGVLPVPRADRHIAAQGRQVYDEVRLAALKTDGAMALAGRIMNGITNLDEHRQSLHQNDPFLITALMEIEVTALRSVQKIQRELYGF